MNQRARNLVAAVRKRKAEQGVLEAFMQEYDLSSEEGVVLMCLAEALLRIPDDDTAEKLIADKLGDADWESHLGKSSSVFDEVAAFIKDAYPELRTLINYFKATYIGLPNVEHG